MKKLIILSILFSVLTFTSCKKDDDSGLQPKGNYPEVSTLLFSLTSANWGHVGTAGTSGDGYVADLLATNITADIAATGTVLCYVSPDNATWLQLNYTIPFSTWSESWIGFFSTGHYGIEVMDSDFLTQMPTGTTYARLITMTHTARLQNPNVDLSNYNEVKKAFNLKD